MIYILRTMPLTAYPLCQIWASAGDCTDTELKNVYHMFLNKENIIDIKLVLLQLYNGCQWVTQLFIKCRLSIQKLEYVFKTGNLKLFIIFLKHNWYINACKFYLEYNINVKLYFKRNDIFDCRVISRCACVYKVYKNCATSNCLRPFVLQQVTSQNMPCANRHLC